MAATLVQDRYRLPLLGAPDPLFRKCLKIAGGVGAVVLAIALFTPKWTTEMTEVDDVPERFAKLILQEPAAAPAPRVKVPEPPKVLVDAPKPPEVKPKPEIVRATPPKADVGARRMESPKLAEDRGKVGREKAQEVTQQLAAVTGSLDDVLGDLSSALESSTTDTPKASRGRRKTRGGRSASDVGTVAAAGAVSDAPSASASAIGGSQITIEASGPLVSEGMHSDGSRSKPGAGASRQDLRTDASLLAVVRRYAPGIQFCYDNELEKHAGLGGKLIIAITVAASGQVTGAQVVRDTVGSPALVSCATSQIETWRFPAIQEGVVTFQAPFIFTPPE
jgi:TonB family protein